MSAGERTDIGEMEGQRRNENRECCAVLEYMVRNKKEHYSVLPIKTYSNFIIKKYSASIIYDSVKFIIWFIYSINE